MNIERSFNPDNWVDNYSDELYRYTVTRISDNNNAEDIVQETFLSAWKAKDTYKGEASEKNWLYAICKNKIIDYFRKQSKNITQNSSLDEEDIYFDEVEHWRKEPTPKEWGIDYGQSIESKEFYWVLEACTKKLKSIQKSVFEMKYMEEVDAENICKVLDITPSNYWVIVHRCKLHLRSCLEKNWVNI
jgi:RNA polymerase sigma-70 factor (TIGR02943 family)